MTFARQSLGSLATLAFGIAASIVLSRALGAAGRGEYALAIGAAGLIMALAQWGIPEVLLQFVGERRAPRGTLVGTTLLPGAVGAALLGLVFWLLFPLFGPWLFKGVDPLLVLAALIGSLPGMLGLLARRYIQLDGRIGFYNALDVARIILFLLLAFVLAGWAGWQAWGAMWAWLAGEILVALLSAWYLVRHVRGWSVDAPLARSLLLAGLPVQAGVLATFLGNEAGKYVLNYALDPMAVGVYVVALSIARLVLQVSMALRTVLQPRLVQPGADAAAVTTRVTRHGILWMALVAVGLAIASPLVPAVFGADFDRAVPVLLAALPGMLAYGLMQLLAGQLLRMGRRRTLAVTSTVLALGSVSFQWVGALAAGAPGAAAGLSLAYACSAVLVLAAFVRLTGRPARTLLPGLDEVRFYRGLTSAVLAGRQPDAAAPVR